MIRALILSLVVAAPAFAAGPPDPDWPCIQRRQPSLSLAQVWAGPLPDEATLALAETPEVQAVAQFIALRRTPMEEAEERIAAFAAEQRRGGADRALRRHVRAHQRGARPGDGRDHPLRPQAGGARRPHRGGARTSSRR